MIVDLFAGPRGWDTGLRMLGIADVHGIENDPNAHATAMAAGHKGELADITTLDPRDYGNLAGLIASPPCPGFSMAGKGDGRKDLELILAAAADLDRGIDPATVFGMLRAWQKDDRSALTLEPLHWALATRPSWIAFEQVPAVLPIWEAYAAVLRARGYNAWTGLVYAEQYGVPQTRRRSVLLASLNQAVSRPAVTHSRYYERTPAKFDHGVSKWVSMFEALDWGLLDRPSPTITGGGTETGGAEPIAKLSRYTSRPGWLSTTTMPNATTRPIAAPAPTVAFGNDAASFVFHDGADDLREAKRTGRARRITVAEAAILQTFPADYPWHGGLGQTFQQCGNAVPPLLAAHLIAELGVGALPTTNLQLLASA